ncbi:hypothetical protein [Streptomyces olivaceus]|uniref:hypothetical protein n=1 Tax=Streptomyces olivaceus TaxID=47716 RepID=UPI0036277590
MRILSSDDLLRREAAWLRRVASWTRRYDQAFPDLDDGERAQVRMAVLYAWMRTRYSVGLQFVANYIAVVVTAAGVAAAAVGAGAVAALFTTDTGGSARAPWWLFPTAAGAALCLATLIAARNDVREIAALFLRLGLRGMAWRITHPQVAYWFVPATILATAATAAAATWLTVETASSAPAGHQLITAVTGLFGAVLGLQVGRWIHMVESLVSRRFQKPQRRRPLDAVLVELMAAMWACFRGRAQWWEPGNIKAVRARLALAVEAASDTTTVRRRMSITEVAVRRRARQEHAALAELIRRHDRAITQVRTAQEYDAITDSLRVGALALATGDLETLMEHSSAEPPASRGNRLMRRTGSSLILATFAMVIPLLPGVNSATGNGVRVLLLMTAVLALLQVGDSASGSIRSALERSLFTNSTS